MHTSLDQALGRQPRLNRVGQSLLNIGSGASAAYSLRSLTGGEPKAVRIRRDGDNEERDFTTAEIVNEAAAWTNGLQETALPADLGVTSFTTSALAYGLSSSGVSLAGGASLDDFDGTFTPNSDGTVWSNGSALGVNYAFGAGAWVLNFNDGTNSGSISINATTKYPFEVTNWGSAGVSSGVSGLASAWDQSFTDSYLDFAAAYGETTTYPTADAAYSLREVRSTYTGDVVKVRRESDNAEKGFTASEISSGALVDFVNADGTQFMNFDGTDDDITTPALLPATDDFTLTIVAFIESNPSSAMGIFGSAASGSGRHNIQINTDGTVKFFCENLGGTVTTTSAIIQKSINTIVLTRTGQAFELTLNGGGAASRTGSSVVLTTGNNNIGDPYVGGNFQGVITSLSVASTTWDGTIANVPVGSTVNGSPSTNALNDGFVTTWYDQSGSSKNATQTTAANQPLIVESGSLHTDGGKPALKFNGTSHRLELSAKATIANTSIFSAFRSNTNTQDSVLFHLAVDASNAVSIGLGDLATRTELGSRLRVGGSNVVEVGDNTFTSTSQSLLSYIASSSAAKMFVDSTEETDTVEARTSGPNNRIGARGDDDKFFNGDISEVILFNSDQTNNRFKIESNINNHYTIYTAAQNGFVNKWYDQSGNGFNAVADADANEPKIVNSGSLLTDGVKFSSGTALKLSGTGLDIFKNTQHAQVFYAIKINDTSTSTTGFFEARTNASVARFLLRNSDVTAGRISLGGRRLDSDSFSRIESGSGHSNEKVVLTGFINYSDTDAFIFQNGTQVGSDTSFLTAGATSDTSSTTITIGRATASSTAEFDAEELIIFNTDQTSNRTAIETNIANEYGITLS